MSRRVQRRLPWASQTVGAMYVLGILFGAIGWRVYLGNEPTATDIAYRVLTLFTVNASFDERDDQNNLKRVPAELDAARFLSPAALAGTAVTLALSFLRKTCIRFRVRLTYRRHIVFVGCDTGALMVAEDVTTIGKVVFLVPKGGIPPSREVPGSVTVTGPRSRQAGFRQAQLHRASHVFVQGRTDAESLALAREVESFLAGSRVSPDVFVRYSSLFGLRVARDLDSACGSAPGAGSSPRSIGVRPFNLELQMARELLDRHLLREARAPGPASGHSYHAALFGFDALGQALAFEMAEVFHFPRAGRPRITVVDFGVAEKWGKFIARHPGIARIVDVACVEADRWREELQRFEKEVPLALTVVTIADAALAIDTARALRQAARARWSSDHGHPERPVIVIAPPIEAGEGFPEPQCRGGFVESFGIELASSGDLLRGSDIITRAESCDAIARGIHYSWLAGPNGTWAPSGLERAWAELPDALRDSNRYAARHMLVKLQYLGWTMVPRSGPVGPSGYDYSAIPEETLETLGRMEHERWMAEKYLDGYLPTDCAEPATYARLKAVDRLHRNLVPWEELSREDQVKDLNVLIHAEAIVTAAGMRMVRR